MFDITRRHPTQTALSIAALMLVNAYFNTGEAATFIGSALIASWFALSGNTQRCG